MKNKNNKNEKIFSVDGPDEYIRIMSTQKTIALIAHDNRKKDLLDWVNYNRNVLREHKLLGTGTTGTLITNQCKLPVTLYQSGPLGGDQQIGAEICNGKVDIVIFFWDPLLAQPHDPDVKALLRLAVLYNIPTACNRATADFMISSELFHGDYHQRIINYARRRPPINLQTDR